MWSRLHAPFVRTLTVVLAFNGLAGFAPPAANAQRNRVIVVNADQPNVWTLEQAHYLLAQMHRRNLDLRAKRLEDLDPNEIAGLRFDVLRTLIEFGATFNQADLASNRLLTENQNFNAERRQSLILRRDQLREESLTLMRQIAELEDQKADAEGEEDKARLDAQIAAKTALRSRVDKEIEFHDNELKTLTAPSGQLRATEAGATFDPNRLPKSTFDKAFEEAARSQIQKFNEEPRLNATLRLDNFLQMQYEIIAKQLTLLRDEVGPGERLLFLELPQTVNVAHHEANQKWAQSWWKILGYTKVTDEKKTDKEEGAEEGESFHKDNERPDTATQRMDRIMQAIGRGCGPGAADAMTYVCLDNGVRVSGGVTIDNHQVRTVELIPRQSSLNVNDMKLRVRSGAFNFVLSTLFGFGSRLNVQRQREQFTQFVQQELYSSAFGKGSREFGWTFTPMPGTDRLQSGVRTTYAVIVVPEEATSLVLESNGCYFPRSQYQPNDFLDTKNPDRWGDRRTSRGCGGGKAFVVPIPVGEDGQTNFWVRGIAYKPVPKGERIVVLVSGKNFSSQIGVLVNGVPLLHSIGLAQPLIRDDSRAGAAAGEEFADAEVRGRVERVDSNKIVFSFEMPEEFEGTPAITLVAPGKAIDINWLDNVDINGKYPASLNTPEKPCKAAAEKKEGGRGEECVHEAEAMFQGSPPKSFRIDSVEVFQVSDKAVAVLITGAGFAGVDRVYVNGVEEVPDHRSGTLLHLKELPAPADDKIAVTLSAGDKTVKSTAIANPAQLRIDRVRVISYEAASARRPGVLVVRIQGSGFTDGMSVTPTKVTLNVTSSTEAFLTIPSPNETEVVTLTHPVTKQTITTVVGRKPPKE
jgi:hypothetical protein